MLSCCTDLGTSRISRGGECQQPTVRIPRAHRGYDKFKAQEDSEAQCAFQQPGVAVELYK
jgi:hypothetical protein